MEAPVHGLLPTPAPIRQINLHVRFIKILSNTIVNVSTGRPARKYSSIQGWD